jgi:hypothetical protein
MASRLQRIPSARTSWHAARRTLYRCFWSFCSFNQRTRTMMTPSGAPHCCRLTGSADIVDASTVQEISGTEVCAAKLQSLFREDNDDTEDEEVRPQKQRLLIQCPFS